MDMQSTAQIVLEAQDNASTNIQTVMRAMDLLRQKFEDANAAMAKTSGAVAGFQAIDNAVRKTTTTLVNEFRKAGMETEATMLKLVQENQRLVEQMERNELESARRADAARMRNIERTNQAQITQRQRMLATLDRLEDEANAERSRGDWARLQQVERVAAAEIAARQRVVTATAGGTGGGFFGGGGVLGAMGMGGGGGGGGGGLPFGLGGIGDLLGKALSGGLGMIGSVGSAAFNAVLAPARAVLGVFESMRGTVSGVTDTMTHMLAIGAGFYSLHQIVNRLEEAFHSIFDAIVGFQDRVVQVQSLTLEGGKNIDYMREQVLRLSMETGRPAEELGNALFFIESHGYDAAGAMVILDKASKMAASGLGETDDIIRIVAGQMVAYGVHAEDAAEKAGHFFDVFARTEQLASLPIGELSGQFQRLTPVVAALNIPIEEVGAAIATISQTGLGAGRVITDLGAALQSLVDITPKGREALKAISYPIEQVRQDIADPSKGLQYTLHRMWEQSGHDVERMGDIFGDGARALVGYLALMTDNARKYEENLQKMRQAAGAVENIWAINQQRISVQLDRSEAIFRAYGIAITESLIPGVTKWWDAVNDAFQSGDINRGFELVVEGFQSAGRSILSTLDKLASSMFGAGANIISELAKGIIESTNNILNQAVQYAADLIAGFLLGASPPKYGPLHYIRQGQAAWAREYAGAMTDNAGIMAGAAERVATVVNDKLAMIGQVKAGALGTAEGVESQLRAIEAQLMPWELASETIKANYEAMLTPLDLQIRAIERIKDMEYERKKLQFDQREMMLDQLKLQAEGDPARRAALAGQMRRAELIREGHDIQRQMAAAQRRMREPRRRGQSAQEYRLEQQAARDDLAILRIKQQQFNLTNQEAAVRYASGKEKLDADKAAAELQHRAFELQKQMTLQPIIAERDRIKAQMETELDYIKLQTIGLNQQKDILSAQHKILKDMEGDAKKGAGAAGIGWKQPEPLKLPSREEAIAKAANDMFVQLRDRLQQNLGVFWALHGRTIGQSIMGFILGGMVGGLPAAITGAAVMPKLFEALRDRGIDEHDLAGFVGRVRTSLVDAFGKAGQKLSTGDLLGTVESLKGSISEWVTNFEKAFFAEWYTVNLTGIGALGALAIEGNQARQRFLEENQANIVEGTFKNVRKVEPGTPGATRWTGLGRTILEAMFPNDQRIKDLNFQTAKELIDENIIQPARRALQEEWDKIFVNRVAVMSDEGFSSQGPRYMTQAERMGEAILNAITTAFQWVGVNIRQPAETLGKLLGDSLVWAINDLSKNEAFKTSVSTTFEALGKNAVGSFAKAFADSLIPALGDAMINQTPQGKLGSAIREGLGLPKITEAPREPLGRPSGGPRPDRIGEPSPLEIVGGWGADVLAFPGKALEAIQGFVESATSEETISKITAVGVRLATTFLGGYDGVMRPGSPSRTMHERGAYAVEGFNNGIADNDSLTGAVVRTWMTDQVLDQARAILVGGGRGIEEGSSVGMGGGGLRGVANEAISGMNDVFAAGVPGYMQANLNSFGRAIVTGIMTPIKGPNGLAAQLRAVYADLPTAPRPAGGGGGARVEAYQHGGSFTVGGVGGPDSQYVRFMATPGEQVTITPQNAARAQQHLGGSGGVTVNGPLVNVEHMDASDPSQLDDVMDRVREFLVNDVRTARGSGVQRPQGVTPRGSR